MHSFAVIIATIMELESEPDLMTPDEGQSNRMTITSGMSLIREARYFLQESLLARCPYHPRSFHRVYCAVPVRTNPLDSETRAAHSLWKR